MVEPTCVICEELARRTGLHKASMFDIHLRMRKCAQELLDRKLLAKLAPGDMIALEAKCTTPNALYLCITKHQGLIPAVTVMEASRADTSSDSDGGIKG